MLSTVNLHPYNSRPDVDAAGSGGFFLGSDGFAGDMDDVRVFGRGKAVQVDISLTLGFNQLKVHPFQSYGFRCPPAPLHRGLSDAEVRASMSARRTAADAAAALGLIADYTMRPGKAVQAF